MAEVSNSKINERSNVKRLNLRVTKRGNGNWERWFISKKIWKLTKLREVRNIEWTKNYKINNFRSQILVCTKTINLLIFQFERFQKFPVLNIPRIPNMENSKNFQSGKFQTLQFWKFKIIFIFENSEKMANLENFENF